MDKLLKCPFCQQDKIFIGVHDDEGNYHGRIGCEYEKEPWSGLSYALHHEGWGDCILCTDDEELVMGGVLFDSPDEAEAELDMELSPEAKYAISTHADAIIERLDKLLKGGETNGS